MQNALEKMSKIKANNRVGLTTHLKKFNIRYYKGKNLIKLETEENFFNLIFKMSVKDPQKLLLNIIMKY